MFKATTIINNETGLHARPASLLAAECIKYESEITINTADTEIHPKSIISILAGGVFKGTEVTLVVEGPDEDEAGASIMNLLNNLPD